RCNAGDDFLAGLVLRDLEVGEHAPDVLVIPLDNGVAGSLAHVAVVHPVLLLGRRHHDLRFRERGLAVRCEQTVIWSPWKCEMITTSTALRSMPAAARLVWNWPTAPLLWSYKAGPRPVSMTTSLPPVLTTIGV